MQRLGFPGGVVNVRALEWFTIAGIEIEIVERQDADHLDREVEWYPSPLTIVQDLPGVIVDVAVSVQH